TRGPCLSSPQHPLEAGSQDPASFFFGDILPMRDYPALYKKLERTLLAIEESQDIARMLGALLEQILVTFRDDLCFSSGRLYRLDGDRYRLVRLVGDGQYPPDFSVPLDYGPISSVRANGYVMMRRGDPGVRADIESELGVDHFAAICF